MFSTVIHAAGTSRLTSTHLIFVERCTTCRGDKVIVLQDPDSIRRHVLECGTCRGTGVIEILIPLSAEEERKAS
jgi:hypothetical protein